MRDESLSRRRVLSEIDAQYHSHDCSVDDVLRMLQFLYVSSLEHNDGMIIKLFDVTVFFR